MSFCSKCGKQNDDAAKFCTGCGAVLKTARKVKNKKIFYFILLFVLAVGVGLYFKFFNTHPPKKDKNIVTNSEPKSNQNSDSLKIENKNDNTEKHKIAAKRNIPTPLVPMVRAANVLPQWTESEELSGDHDLIGLYIGAIGKKPIKLFITNVDTVNNILIGYSIVGSNNVNFKGSFTKMFKKGASTKKYTFNDFDAWIYTLTLFEPEGIDINGVFQLVIEDAGIIGTYCTFGSWISYNGKLYRELSIKNPHDFAADR